jgi:hypothetical protein
VVPKSMATTTLVPSASAADAIRNKFLERTTTPGTYSTRRRKMTLVELSELAPASPRTREIGVSNRVSHLTLSFAPTPKYNNQFTLSRRVARNNESFRPSITSPPSTASAPNSSPLPLTYHPRLRGVVTYLLHPTLTSKSTFLLLFLNMSGLIDLDAV